MEELIRNIMGFEEYAEPPTFRVHKLVGNFTSEHILQFSDSKRYCKVYYRKDKKKTKGLQLLFRTAECFPTLYKGQKLFC